MTAKTVLEAVSRGLVMFSLTILGTMLLLPLVM